MQNNLKNIFTAILISLLLLCNNAHAWNFLKKNTSKDTNEMAKEIQKRSPDETEYFIDSFPRDEEIKATERKTGSLFVKSYSSDMYRNLNRASQIGDMVTILIEETAQGKKVAETKADRKGQQKMGIGGLFGLISKLTGLIPGLEPDKFVDATSDNKHEGKGETKRSGSLDGKLTARVVRVLRNGDMQIRGQKNIKLNGEEQVLIVEGFVRPYDISAENTVLSSMLADARITFNGFGTIADQQKPGWLKQIFDKILPF